MFGHKLQELLDGEAFVVRHAEVHDVLAFDLGAQTSTDVTQVVYGHCVVAAEVEPTLMAEEVVAFTFALELGSKLLGDDLNTRVLDGY